MAAIVGRFGEKTLNRGGNYANDQGPAHVGDHRLLVPGVNLSLGLLSLGPDKAQLLGHRLVVLRAGDLALVQHLVEHHLKRKITEIVRAVRFTQNNSKESTLLRYLNIIPLGSGCEGVGAGRPISHRCPRPWSGRRSRGRIWRGCW